MLNSDYSRTQILGNAGSIAKLEGAHINPPNITILVVGAVNYGPIFFGTPPVQGIMEKKVETTTMGYIGAILGYGSCRVEQSGCRGQGSGLTPTTKV